MNKKNESKSDFVKFIISSAEENSCNFDDAKTFLSEEGVNVDKTIADGLRRIKQMHTMAEAKRTQQEMQQATAMKEKATQWVDSLLAKMDFSLPDLVRDEELTMSFRNVEELSQEDIRNLLIKHFMLKFSQDQTKNSK
ncbi:MAG: hypothetical protein INR73_07995 [Williamsia sp.]|nr:hypothetical protein [Williamsia sp.]